MQRKLHIKKGDVVFVNTGNDRGKTGKVLEVLTTEERAIVEGINMWLGEKITDKGIGNGISLIIMIGIIARLPFAFAAEFGSRIAEQTGGLVMLLVEIVMLFMDLSVRALNCLKAAEVETLGDLVKFNKNDLLKFRNFGKKSLTELDELLESLNLTFGMDVTKYKLDKE